MRALLFLSTIAVGLSLGASSAAPADWPPLGAVTGQQDVLVPNPANGSDYVATLEVARAWGPAGKDAHIVTRRGDWLRIDKTEGGRSSTSYVGLKTGVWVSLATGEHGTYRSVQLRPLSETAQRAAPEIHQTDEQEIVLGETCRIWEGVGSVGVADPGIRRRGCVTNDGIELWRRTTGSAGIDLGSARVTSLERRSVTRAFAEPPEDLLDLSLWNDPARPTSKPIRDFEVLLAGGRDGVRAIIRRHYPWTYEDVATPRRSIRSDRIDGSASLRVDLRSDGKPDGLVFRRNEKPGAAIQAVPIKRPPEIILGENCSWFDMMPGVSDAGRIECRTPDGIPLKVIISGWGEVRAAYVAQKVSRRTLAVSDVLPPPATLDPRLWGLKN